MILIDNKLKERVKANNPINVGIVGAGVMADVLISQVSKFYPSIKIVAISNRTIDKADDLYKKYELAPVEKIDSVGELDENINKDRYSITKDYSLLAKSVNIDVIVEITGTVEFGAKVVMTAIDNKKDIITFNAELDATIGPILSLKAKKAGVIYSGSDGDQPGVTTNLYRYVKSLGLTPLVCGNIKGFHNPYRTPDTQKEFAQTWQIDPEKATSFADGTKLSFEQCCVANATGMQVEQTGMRGETVNRHVDECLDIYNVEKIEKLGGVIDYMIGAKPGPGVFVYAKTDDPILKHQLKYLKMGDGPLYSFYTPYHLCMLEVPNSIVRVVDFKDNVLAPLGKPFVEVIARAKTDLKEGTVIDGYGKNTVYGECENSEVVQKNKQLPIGLAKGAKLKKALKKDSFISFDDIEFETESLALSLYKEQQKVFKQGQEIRIK